MKTKDFPKELQIESLSLSMDSMNISAIKPHSHQRQHLHFRQIVTLYYHRQFDANAKNGFYTHSLQ